MFISRYFGIGSVFFLFSSIEIITIRYKNTQKNIEYNYIYRYYNKVCFCNALLANSMLNGLSVKLIYKIVSLKNTRLRPLVKITTYVSNFLTRYRTTVFFKEEKNLSGLLVKKNCQSAKPQVPPQFLKQFRSFCERLW